MMYWCTDCQSLFDESEMEVEELSHDSEIEPGETLCKCPNCGSDDFEEADRCECCGEYIRPGRTLCEDCEDAADNEIRNMFARFGASQNIRVSIAKDILLERIAVRY